MKESYKFLISVIMLFGMLMLLGYAFDALDERVDIQLSDGSIVHDVKASDLGPGINATAYQAMLDDLEHNLTIHIAANATQNISIWKGDRLICFIPR